MRLSKLALLALSIAALGATAPANAQGQQPDKPFDFKPLLPPVVPVPPNSAVTSGSVGGTQNPYTTAPLQSPSQPSSSQSSPGMRFTIPTR
jgi:hypothetical protein